MLLVFDVAIGHVLDQSFSGFFLDKTSIVCWGDTT